jgi:hypothetical protein
VVLSTYSADGISVYDAVLTDDEFRTLQQWAELARYQGVHHEQWRSVWRHGEGEPLRGPTWSIPTQDVSTGNAPGNLPTALWPLAVTLVRTLREASRTFAGVSLTPWIYPTGTALGLHKDDGSFAGSYIFYTVPEWDVHWGGLLHCVADPPDAEVPRRAILDMTAERRSVSSVGRGPWIAPAANRLVTLAPHVRHFISRVDPNAGDRPRTSIAGFLHRTLT